jgi:hypothetical protein
MSTMSTADTFDRWLEGQLRHELLPLTAAAAPAARYASSRPGLWSLRLSLATAIAVAALLITGTGALAATVTGSVNPRVWGEQLRDCGLVLGESGHSFRECFSDLTRKQETGGSGALPIAPTGKERDIDRPAGPVTSAPAAAGYDPAGGGAPESNPARAVEGDEGPERGDDRESGKGEDRKKREPEKGDSEKGGGGGRD